MRLNCIIESQCVLLKGHGGSKFETPVFVAIECEAQANANKYII